MSDNVSPLLPEQFEELRRLELEAAASAEYGELPERRTTFDTPPATPVLTWQGQVVAAAGSLVLICGQAKAGKTTALVGIMKACLAGGGPVLGMPELVVNVPPSGLCAWYDTEMPLDLFDRNMKWVCGTEAPPDHFFAFHLRSFGHEETKERIFNSIFRLRPAVVVVDGLADLIPGGINDEMGCPNVIRELMGLAERSGSCIFCVIHDNQGATAQTIGRSRGHLGAEFERKCDGSFVCERKEDAIVLRVRQIRRGYIPQDLAIRFDSENRPYGDGVWEETGKPSTAKKKESTRETLIDMYGGKELAYTELVTKIMEIEGHGKRTAQSRVKDMGFLKTAAGTYLIPSG